MFLNLFIFFESFIAIFHTYFITCLAASNNKPIAATKIAHDVEFKINNTPESINVKPTIKLSGSITAFLFLII